MRDASSESVAVVLGVADRLVGDGWAWDGFLLPIVASACAAGLLAIAAAVASNRRRSRPPMPRPRDVDRLVQVPPDVAAALERRALRRRHRLPDDAGDGDPIVASEPVAEPD